MENNIRKTLVDAIGKENENILHNFFLNEWKRESWQADYTYYDYLYFLWVYVVEDENIFYDSIPENLTLEIVDNAIFTLNDFFL